MGLLDFDEVSGTFRCHESVTRILLVAEGTQEFITLRKEITAEDENDGTEGNIAVTDKDNGDDDSSQKPVLTFVEQDGLLQRRTKRK